MACPCEIVVTRRTLAVRNRLRAPGRSAAWAISLLLHVAVLFALSAAVISERRGGVGGGRVGGDGIVLSGRFAGPAAGDLHEPLTSRFTVANAAPALLEIAPIVRPLPQPVVSDVVLASATSASTEPRQPAAPPGGSAEASRSPSSAARSASGGDAQLFGVPGRGSRIVYVFDRSASMDGGRLAAAKRELIASLHALPATHQFQVIFYSQEPDAMPSVSRGAPRTPGALHLADERGKRLAEQFVRGIFADGPTKHLPALALALDLRPDVIYFLTDADEPQLDRDELQSVRRRNLGTAIHAIEFGSGPSPAGRNFLQQLAAENGGQHAYVDVNQFVR